LVSAAVRLVGLCCLLCAGCGGQATPVPGVTYVATLITKAANGAIVPQQASVSAKTATVGHEQELGADANQVIVHVRKTEYGRATFEITFSDKSVQRVKVDNGMTKDVFPKGKTLGVRIEVQEAR
jgi:hypothetical protein